MPPLPPPPPSAPRFDETLNPPEEQRQYSSYLGDNKPAFGLSTLGNGRLWRLTSNNPSPYSHWLQISVGDVPLRVSGIAITPGAIWQGAMFISKFNVRVCPIANMSDDGASCNAWEDALNEEGGTSFDGSQNSGVRSSDNHYMAVGGANHVTRAFFQAPIATQLVRIYPYGACPWVCGLRAGLLVYDDTPSAPPIPPLPAPAPPAASLVALSPVGASMSTEYPGHGAAQGIDGDLSTQAHSSSGGETDPWLQVDLGSAQSVGYVQIHNKDGTCGTRLGHHEIYLKETDGGAETLCASAGTGGDTSCSSATVPGPGPFMYRCTGTARYVKIKLPGPTRMINIPEVLVYEAP